MRLANKNYRAFSIKIKTTHHSRKEMMGLIGAGNNPMVGMTVACAVAVSMAK